MQESNIANNLYALYESLPYETQQEFFQKLVENNSEQQVFSQEEKEQNTNRTEEHQERAIKIYDAYRDDLRKRQLSNSENYDKTVLTLSSSGLALSLTAIKFAIPLATAKYLISLQWSWWLFGTTILSMIVAYWIGNKALDKQLEIAEDYYAKSNEDAFSTKNWYAIVNNWLNIFAGLTFLIATALIISFVTSNINLREFNMSNENRKITFDSANVPKMQSTPGESREKLSANVPSMQLAPRKQPAPQPPTQSATGNKSNK
jgi:hypothetical protein